MGSKVRLGVRNTFNILPKFFLLLLVFLFVVFAVISEYTSLQHSEEEASNLGYNDFLYNYSQDRIVVKKGDGSQFTDADLKAMKSISNVRKLRPTIYCLTIPSMWRKGTFHMKRSQTCKRVRR